MPAGPEKGGCMSLWIPLWIAVGAFSVVNWHVLMAPVGLDFIVAQVTAPLGVAMLGAVLTAQVNRPEPDFKQAG